MFALFSQEGKGTLVLRLLGSIVDVQGYRKIGYSLQLLSKPIEHGRSHLWFTPARHLIPLSDKLLEGLHIGYSTLAWQLKIAKLLRSPRPSKYRIWVYIGVHHLGHLPPRQ